ncbi:hypothetical protein GCM10010123_43120 [Pilimelia anulata]|uniref:Mycothiol-dependent maleylpyruvate isomerase metal-binding domain-containing protein n=1 Tax=Pilimelia anulata TaxID=53371 RepID=A0A8J3BED9_9ACTN|nr:hypothetical protein [Pilimelia anulata]GGK08605.1 hypothetical protein GCM10010123_43120 [Pilimelia anulata]
MALLDLYRGAFADLAARAPHLDPDLPVPATPGWSAADVYRHLAGVCADVLDDRTDGAPGADWTARHVAERRHLSPPGVVEAWRERLPDLYARLGDRRYAFMTLDCWHHRHDIAAAAGAAGDRGDAGEVLALHVGWLARRWPAGLPPLGLRTPAGTAVAGPSGAVPAATVGAPAYELARAVIGRRSLAQWRRYDWSTDPEPYLPHLVVFTPPAADLVE